MGFFWFIDSIKYKVHITVHVKYFCKKISRDKHIKQNVRIKKNQLPSKISEMKHAVVWMRNGSMSDKLQDLIQWIELPR